MDYRNQIDYQSMGYAPVGAFAPRVEYGGFWIRVGAYLLDAILLIIVQLILQQMLESSTQASLANAVFGWLYFAGCESMIRGTPGKLVLGMRVADMNGNDISFLRATGRYFAKILSGLILLLGFVMVAFTSNKQGLHDKIAGTLVLKG
jgi:uncharacterized RDD family membrane protein YckC